MNKALQRFTLLDTESAEGFQKIDLGPQSPGMAKTPQGWSVKSYTLRGGLQEGVDVVEIDNGRLRFLVLPTRGMGIWKADFEGMGLGWSSPVKTPVHPAFVNLHDRQGLGWLHGFNEWIVRCGINSIGFPHTDSWVNEDGKPAQAQLTLHGRIANIPAHAVSLEITDKAIILRGEVDEASMFGSALRLNTEIRTEFGSGELELIDKVTNIGDLPADHQMLYHINYGPPLLEKGARVLAPFKQVCPRDARAAEGIANYEVYGAPETGYAEQVYFYELVGKRGSRETLAMLRNAAGDRASVMRFSLKELPAFVVWKHTAGKADGYVTGLEPATCYPNSRGGEREKGRVIRLAGGKSHTMRIRIEALNSKKAVRSAQEEIEALQKTVKPKVHRKPFADMTEG